MKSDRENRQQVTDSPKTQLPLMSKVYHFLTIICMSMTGFLFAALFDGIMMSDSEHSDSDS